MNEAADIKRAKRLRRRILALVDARKAIGGSTGRWLFDTLEEMPPDFIEDPEEIVRLGLDLKNLGLLEIIDTRTLKNQRYGVDFVEFRITAKGTALLCGLEPVSPLVHDERIG